VKTSTASREMRTTNARRVISMATAKRMRSLLVFFGGSEDAIVVVLYCCDV